MLSNVRDHFTFQFKWLLESEKLICNFRNVVLINLDHLTMFLHVVNQNPVSPPNAICSSFYALNKPTPSLTRTVWSFTPVAKWFDSGNMISKWSSYSDVYVWRLGKIKQLFSERTDDYRLLYSVIISNHSLKAKRASVWM